MADTVTERSTKQDIWKAYQELRAQLEQSPAPAARTAPHLGLQDKLKTIATELQSAFADASANIQGQIDQLQSQGATDSKQREQTLEKLADQKTELEREIKRVEEEWRRETEERKLKRQREEDEYRYQLDKKRREEQDAYEAKRKSREAELAAREQAMQEKEDRLAELEKQASGFPAQIETAVKQAKEDLTKELSAKHQAELKERDLAAKHAQQIEQLRINSLEVTLKQRDTQLAEMKSQLESATRQLKDMAVAVIDTKRPAPEKPASGS